MTVGAPLASLAVVENENNGRWASEELKRVSLAGKEKGGGD